ncbi:metallophosphoesterase family protein [Bacillus weihaiensis]|uniref:Nuclease SbcCD subunit D n=1 Tax=Bacillus weihaiensis TaxID=1547283 RepID=A0A1L3MUF6_9BACI|nr:exonuclease SbcCD subunit D C-terminal domain-containing protein [Bacillus weihaiensis]APH05976.1 exonuclease sbcCD subunit D [Bacillus weihaiensis]
MRILHTADWHLGRSLEGRSRLVEQAEFIDELVKIVEEEQIDAILMAGDAFDTVNPPAAAEQLFYEGLSRLSDHGRRPIIVIAGNHDNPDRLSAASPLTGNHAIHLIGYPLMDTIKIDVPKAGQKMQVAALAYPSEARLEQILSAEHEEVQLRNKYDEKIREIFGKMSEQFQKDTVNIAMSHIHVAGGSSTDSERPIEVGGAYTVAATSMPEAAQYVALGHLHRPQTIKRASTLTRYSGSPLAYSFSEIGYTKSVTIIEAQPNQPVEIREIPLSSGKPLVKWKATEGITQVHQWLDEGKDANAWIDLQIHLTSTLSIEEIHRLRKWHPGFIHIRPVFEQELEVAATRQANVPIDQLFTQFYEKQTGGAKPEDELIKLFLELVNQEDESEEGDDQ